ncbi:HAD-IA family hydrolase [Subtercola vilae]|uniref:HAD family hydrolase n=1 Tax=Subtercola vilae TaxID=2056433 RepID=A0A4T2C3T0_9MICO|nr:HAD-IA family hydrolase [Subtercola vilae]TIH38680.1 HAD family hydrolase [Subtercola vilae]
MTSAPHPAFAGRTFAAALFDMDGTLIDSTPAVDRAWSQWGTEFGLPDGFRDGMHGKPARGLVADLLPADRVEEGFARVQALELVDLAGITVLPGAAELLSGIPEPRRAIVTSCTRDLAAVRIAASGIPAPAVVVTIDDTVLGKPNPDPFLEGARRLSVDPRDCVVFEDAPAGLAAARAAGCATVGVVGTHRAGQLDADLVVESLADVRLIFTADGFSFAV